MSAGVADVATLGLAVNSDPLVTAKERLQDLATTSAKTEGATNAVTSATDALVAALNRNTQATTALTGRMDAVAASTAKVADGVSKVEKAANDATSATAKLDASSAKLAATMSAQAKAAQEAAAAAQAGAKAAQEQQRRQDATRAAIDPVWASQERLNKTTADADDLLKRGIITQDTHARAVRVAGSAHDELARKVASSGKEHGLAGHQLQNLTFQLNDVTTMALSGASAFQIFATQAGQLVQIGQSSQGGLKGLFTQATEGAQALAGRIGLVGGALGALAIGFGVATYAAVNYRNEQKELERSTFGIGRASGATLDSLQRSAQEAATRSDSTISVSTARDVVGTLNATGKINPQTYAPVAASMDQLSKQMGTDIPTATDFMTKALAGGIEGFNRLNETLLLGGDPLRKQVKDLYEQGDAFGAQTVIIDAYLKKLKENADQPSALSVFLFGKKGIVAQTQDELTSIGSLFGKRTQEDQLGVAKGRLSNLQQQSDAGFKIDPIAFAAAKAEVEKIEASIAKTAQGSKEAKTTLQSLTVGPLVESLNPAQQRIDAIRAKAKEIQDYLDNGGDKLDKDGSARRTMQGLNDQAVMLTLELGKGGAALATGLDRAKFELKTVGFSDYAKSRADIVESDRIARQQIDTANPEPEKRAEQIKTLDDKLKAQLDLLDTQVKMTAQSQSVSGGGRYNKTLADAPESMQGAITRSAAASGYSPDLISSIIWKESRYNPNVKDSPAGAQGVGQFLPGTASDMGVNVRDIESSIMGIGKYLNAIKKMTGLTDEKDIVQAYNWGPGNMQKYVQRGRTGNVPAEAQDYRDTIFTPGVGSATLSKETRDRAKALELETALTREATAAMGRDGDGLQARQEVMQRVAAEQLRGVEVTKEMIATYRQEAEARAKLNAEARITSYTVQGQWDRDQLGRTANDQRAYNVARSMTNSTDMTSDRAQQIIAEQRANMGLVESKQMATESLNGFISDLRRGATGVQAFANVLNRIGDKAINNVVDSLVSGAFGSFAGGGGGAAASATSSAGGMGGIFSTLISGAKSFFGFANGGIMTPYGQMPLHTYSKGGVASSPQAAIFGEGSQNEAYVPLPDGKRIPVAMSNPANSNSAGNSQINYNPTFSITQSPDGMTPAATMGMIQRQQDDFVKSLPMHIRNATKRRA